jgi:hypothetical protein
VVTGACIFGKFRGWPSECFWCTSKTENILHCRMNNNIRVERERLCSPLRDLQNLNPALVARMGRCKLSLEGDSLLIATPVMSIYVPATGDWQQDVSVELADLVAAEGAIAQIPMINIAMEGDTLLIGGVEVDFVAAR